MRNLIELNTNEVSILFSYTDKFLLSHDAIGIWKSTNIHYDTAKKIFSYIKRICSSINLEHSYYIYMTDKSRLYTIKYKEDEYFLQWYGDKDATYRDNYFKLYTKKYDPNHIHFVEKIIKKLQSHIKIAEKIAKINLLTVAMGNYQLHETELPKINKFDPKYYNDGTEEFYHKTITNLSNTGITLLHGVPGTGKSSFIKALTAECDRRFIFVPSKVAAQLDDPNFISLMSDYKESVIVIEDAENILENKDGTRNPSVSAILNLSDGILAEAFGLHIIATCNMDFKKIDKAIIRAGRLVAKREFTPLTADKVSSLTEGKLNKSMTVAEVFNDNVWTEAKQTKVGY